MSLEEQINAIGKKDGLECTGEVRIPKKGEWYFDNGEVFQAGFDFKSYRSVILRKIAPATRPMTDAEIFRALRDGAILKNTFGVVGNCWCSENDKNNSVICYNYTGTPADKWQKLEVEVGR